MSLIICLLLSSMSGLASAAMNCSLIYDNTNPMQDQLALQSLVVPFDIDPPYSSFEDGKFQGFSVDVLTEIALRGNFTVTITSAGQAGANETNDQVLARQIANYDFFGSYWTDTPARRATGAMFSIHYVDVTRYLITLPDQIKPPSVTDNMFTFLTPFSGALWIVIVFGICFSGAVTYWFEMSSICGRKHMLEEALESDGKRWKVYWGFIHRSFSHFTMAGDTLEAKSVMGQLHNVVWAFVVLVLLSAYTANLASTIVVKKLKYIEYPTVDAIYANEGVICTSRNDATVATFLANKYPNLRTYDPPHDPALARDQELADALLEGHCVGAVMKTSAYQILRTNVSYCQLDQRVQVGPTMGAGFGFPIERCGPFYLAVVNSILSEMRSDRTLDELWAKEVQQVSCPATPTQTVVASAAGMGLDSFSGLFILYLCWVACMVALRVIRKSFTGLDRLIARARVYFSPNSKPDAADTTDSPKAKSEFDTDMEALHAKVAGVEHTMEHLMTALRDLHHKPTNPHKAEQTHQEAESKQGHARTDSKGTLTPTEQTHKRAESKPALNTPPTPVSKRLSQNTPMSEERAIENPTDLEGLGHGNQFSELETKPATALENEPAATSKSTVATPQENKAPDTGEVVKLGPTSANPSQSLDLSDTVSISIAAPYEVMRPEPAPVGRLSQSAFAPFEPASPKPSVLPPPNEPEPQPSLADLIDAEPQPSSPADQPSSPADQPSSPTDQPSSPTDKPSQPEQPSSPEPSWPAEPSDVEQDNSDASKGVEPPVSGDGPESAELLSASPEEPEQKAGE